jgi:O-methyltransferase involved in polyketide biosynthesis
VQDRPTWVSTNGDAERPNIARLYDYYLGGAHNFAVDREFAQRSTRLLPIDEITRSSRSFLRRAVRTCLDAGIRQFLDLGSGIPTAGNVHEVAQRIDPTTRVVYVDNDPVAVAHSRTMLKGSRTTAIVEADIRDPKAVFDAADTRRLLDLDQPVAVLMVGILPYFDDCDEPAALIATYRDAIAPGSYLVMSHLTGDVEPELAERMLNVTKETQISLSLRAKDEVATFLAGFSLLEPGLVLASRWRGDADEEESAATSISYGAVGIKPVD